jgi:sulfur-oxidizing protein SoxY
MIETGVSRRAVLFGTGAVALALAIAPYAASADVKEVEDELKKLFGDRKIADGRITLDVPQIAENGLVVPLNIDVQSPMTPQDYVKTVHVFADGNPRPNVITFHFTPEAGRASASSRIRLAKTQTITAIAEMSDGSLYRAKSEVKVTIGGCGG